MKKFAALFLAGLNTAAIASQASAIPYQGNTVYKATENAKNYLIVSGTPLAKISIATAAAPTVSVKLASSLGVVSITPPSTGFAGPITATGRTAPIDPAALPVGVLGTTAPTSDFKDAAGKVYLTGYTVNTPVTVSIPKNGTRSATVNNCGFAKVSESTTAPFSTFSIAGTPYSYATLPMAPQAPYCRNIGGVYAGYVPATGW